MRVLITGGSGLLGWWLTRSFVKAGYHVVSTFNTSEPPGLEGVEWKRLDITRPEQVSRIVSESKPDIIIHSAAYTDVDGCEIDRKKALEVNYYGTLWVSRATASRGARLVYISTDYVFDGLKGEYREGDEPNPINYYGLSKLLGEAASLASKDSLVVRVSGLYGYSPTGKRNFAINAVEKLLSGGVVKAFHDQFLSPTYVPELSDLIVKAVDMQAKSLIHIAGDRLSRYQQALMIADVLGVPRDRVKPVSMRELNLPAKRPRDSSLNTSRARSLGLAHKPHEEAVREFVRHYLSVKRRRVPSMG